MAQDVPTRHALTVDQFYAGVIARDAAVLPRALTLIESNNERHQIEAEKLLTRLMPHTGQAIRVGVSGPPGVGKSTFIDALGMHVVGLGKSVAVLAVDPSSGVTGGSIMGDKTRMARLSAASQAYIRPSPSAGTLGGVARKTRESMLVCEAAGFEVILIETVGVGQSETMVANMTDCFLGLMLPGAGDELQGIKRGLLELLDVIAVNKADGETRHAAEVAARQLQNALGSLFARAHDVPPVLTCSALHNVGVADVWEAIAQRHQRLCESGALIQRHHQQQARWLWEIVDDRVKRAIREHPQVAAIRGKLQEQVVEGTLAPEAAARQILQAFGMAVNGHANHGTTSIAPAKTET
ncbi:MAG: methylmalonyl Co-A mutase-associated GTPase MeaB [Planctomycetales bacterium]|nr:methylmalonyl Co-A mutase-associated GTPase MeaB [Planctomycetales bacterium]